MKLTMINPKYQFDFELTNPQTPISIIQLQYNSNKTQIQKKKKITNNLKSPLPFLQAAIIKFPCPVVIQIIKKSHKIPSERELTMTIPKYSLHFEFEYELTKSQLPNFNNTITVQISTKPRYRKQQ